MKPSVLFSVVEYVSHSVAHNKTVVDVNRRVASVENTMDVLAKQNAVGLGVRASFSIRTNVRCVQRGKNLPAGQSALTLVKLRDRYSERALPQPRNDQDWVSIPGLGKSGYWGVRRTGATLQISPEGDTFLGIALIRLPLHDAGAPRIRHAEPKVRWQKHRLNENSANDEVDGVTISSRR
jgi:hypothetical protein